MKLFFHSAFSFRLYFFLEMLSVIEKLFIVLFLISCFVIKKKKERIIHLILIFISIKLMHNIKLQSMNDNIKNAQ